MAHAEVGDLAWAGSRRLIWLVLSEDAGVVVRNSQPPWSDVPREIGATETIRMGGLVPIDEDTAATLTDAEWAVIAKAQLLGFVKEA
jgi:hypothetical protein